MMGSKCHRESALSRAVLCVLSWIFILCACRHVIGAESQRIELVVDTSHTQGSIDLTRYAFGDGDMGAAGPQIAQLHPQTIRFFALDDLNLYPRHNEYRWAALDKVLRAIHATGAQPLMCLCIKPRVLFPEANQKAVSPASWAEWESLIMRLVKHCNESQLRVGYWEVGNEPNLGEAGGSPYLFQPENYLRYYTHTVNAIRRADSHAKVGGPALATWDQGPLLGKEDPFLTALIDYCGKGQAPLDFVSWHLYENDPKLFRREIREVRAMLAKYDTLKNVETILDEWNMSLFNPITDASFQPAFVMETTYAFDEEGLSRSGYYHIRDFFFEPRLSPYLSEEGLASNDHLFNVMPLYLGLFDTEGRVRPAYYAFKILSLMKGERLAITGGGPEVKGFAARNKGWVHVVFWNFPEGEGKNYEVSIRFPHENTGSAQLIRLDPDSAVNNLKIVRGDSLNSLDKAPLHVTLHPYEIYWVELGQ
jgi:hypothetical protein